MESLGAFRDEEWENLSRMLSCEESDHFVLQRLHGHGLFSSEHDDGLSFETNYNANVVNNQSLFYSSDNLNPNFYYYFSQESSNSSTTGISNGQFQDPNNVIPVTNNNLCDQSPSMDFCVMDDNNNNLLAQVFSDDVMQEILSLKQDEVVVEEKGKLENSQGDQPVPPHPARVKRKLEMTETSNAAEDETNNDKADKNPKKISLVSRDKTKQNVQSKKNMQKGSVANTNGNEINDGEETNNNNNNNNNNGGVQSSSSYCSEDDSNASQELNGGALNLNGKTRASRGAATDPQSLYARKRRERINERLRILQNLVPNGTKVDISTMLEEAVHYVKFLQLQIKLLSSDVMWMYAPIAYNGMDMGLYQKISPTL